MARLTYDWPIGFDRPDVEFDQLLAPVVNNYDAELAQEPDLPMALASDAEPSLGVAGDADSTLHPAISDTPTRLATDSELSLQVEADQ